MVEVWRVIRSRTISVTCDQIEPAPPSGGGSPCGTGAVPAISVRSGTGTTTSMSTAGAGRRASLWAVRRSEEHTSELQSRFDLVCRLLLEKKNTCIIHIL